MGQVLSAPARTSATLPLTPSGVEPRPSSSDINRIADYIDNPDSWDPPETTVPLDEARFPRWRTATDTRQPPPSSGTALGPAGVYGRVQPTSGGTTPGGTGRGNYRYMTKCTVELYPGGLATKPGWLSATVEQRWWVAFNVAMHEILHCMGQGHSGASSGLNALDNGDLTYNWEAPLPIDAEQRAGIQEYVP